MLNMCEQCPWRRSNHGKRHWGGFYTKANRRRLWGQIRGGGGRQSCHLTDPSHPDHIKAGAADTAKVHECPGSIALVVRELEKLEAHKGDLKAYRRENPLGLTKAGLRYWLSRYLMGGLDVSKIPDIPESLVRDTESVGRGEL